MLKLAALTALLACAAAGALAQEITPDIDFSDGPSPEDWRAAIPAAARAADRDGEVLVTCAVNAAGRLSGCTVASEEPAGLGYGEAALVLAGKHRLKPASVRGRTSVTFPLSFRPNTTRANWLKRPSEADLRAVWPAEAFRKGVGGRATIACQVNVEGTLQRCTVVAESPEGVGFGLAALSLAPHFQMTPETRNGKPVPGGSVRIPITFANNMPRSGRSTTGTRMAIPVPVFVAAPSSATVAAAHPPGAAGLRGRVSMNCEAVEGGGLRSCDIVTEEPKGKGFGRAAKALAPHFRLPPTFQDGKSVKDALVRVPVQFSPAAAAGETIAKPEWGRLPDLSRAEALYPQAAQAAGVDGGRVMLDCRVVVGGGLGDCRVLRETPSGLGFGQAALDLAEGFGMRPWTSDGRPVDGARVRIPVIYPKPSAAKAP